eukprot:Skav218932  [mRNA]  locus=scaffold678:83969:85975:+ [translate_table: standard]
MARQRVGQLRRFKVLVAIATVMLCFLHLPINGSQTLAVPGGREATRASLKKLMVPQLRTKLRERGLNVSGQKADLVERLMEENRRIPKAEEPAILETHVFIPLDETVKTLEALLQEERVVFLRAGVASGKSTLAQYLCREQPSKYLKVCAPAFDKLASFQNWQIEFRAALENEPYTRDVANLSMRDAITELYDNDQVLVFDECHLLFSCPAFYQQFLKQPLYLEQRPMVLLLSAASEMQSVTGQTFTTPTEITGKYMWTPPMPDANVLVHELAAADVYLSEDAVRFFLHLCGGHRGILMRAMEWVQIKQKGAAKPWTVAEAYGEVKMAWEDGDWGCPDSFLAKLATVRAIRVNGNYADLANIPQKFLEILCGGATSNLESEDRRNLTIHGFLLPVAAKDGTEEFLLYDWSAQGASYGVSCHLLASYYRYVLEKQRQLEVDVNRTAASCTDLLLRAMPYLDFATVVGGVIRRNQSVQADFSAEGLPSEVHYTGAIIQVLRRLGFGATSIETGIQGKVDIYCAMQDGSTFAIEAVMAARGTAVIEKHQNRFDRLPNYKDAKHKCLLIIGRQDSRLRDRVQATLGGIEIVGLAANSAHTGYRVHIKRRGGEVLDFYIPCDGVARSFSFVDEKVSPAQKFKNIRGRILFKPTLVCALKDVGNALGLIGFYCK